MNDYQLMLLIVFVAVAGAFVGFRIGWNLYEKSLNKTLRKEAEEYFRKEYYDILMKEFETRVEKRAYECALEIIIRYEEAKECYIKNQENNCEDDDNKGDKENQ